MECWRTLGIAPTADLAAIKSAYRELVKRYHPDTVVSPEKKRRYTIICARINQAYRQAVREAAAFNEPGGQSPHQAAGALGNPHGESAGAAFRALRSRSSLRALLFFFLALQTLSFFAGPLTGVPDSVKTAVSILVAIFVAAFIYGFMFAGAVDVLIIWFFPRRLVSLVGLEKYESKLAWLSILAANIAMFFFTDLISPARVKDLSVAIADGTLRAIAAGTMPTVLGVNWLRELARYRRVKNVFAQLPSE